MSLATLRQRIADNLGAFQRQRVENPELRRAAVAVALTVEEDGQLAFLLTRRSSQLKRHSGQFALPGGRLDPGETVEQAALRELEEEVGVDAQSTTILGYLDDFATRSGYVITPIVVWAGEVHDLQPDSGEVAHLYRVPLDELERPDLVVLSDIPESDRPVLSIRLWSTRVFAPTGAIIYQLREVAVHGRDTRVSDYEQPVFAWR